MAHLDYPEPNLSDDLVVLRPWSLTDLRCVEEASWDARIPSGTTVPSVFTPEEGRAFIERQWGRHSEGEGLALAIADRTSDEAVGQIVLLSRDQPGVAGVGYWVIERMRGRGFAGGAVRLLSDWVLSGEIFNRVEALVEPDNVPSLRALDASGFAEEQLLRSHRLPGGGLADVFLYVRVRRNE